STTSFFQAKDGIRSRNVTGVQTCALPICLGGRHPLCGTGVKSRIAVISKPAACNERIAASRPAPGPLTDTSRFFIFVSTAAFAATSAAICAANGVDLREPLNPKAPAELHPIVFPCKSEIDTIVLLKVEWI